MSVFSLPADFEEDMSSLLQAEYPAFRSSYEGERYAGLRRNPLKVAKDDFESLMPFKLDPVPWAEEGYYYDLSDRPGKYALHDAGAYYIQEPSAMSAVSVLDPVPGDFVLDMCAAPGGKSTQIAGRLLGKGLLISNEIIKDRSRILSQNIERLGIKNAVVLNEAPAKLTGFYPSFFDKILVDAPCSGEGMFRKEELAVSEWSREHVSMCSDRQLQILDCAADTLKPGGVLVYSTCTFNPRENEGTVSAFIASHPEFEIEVSPLSQHFAPGHPDWTERPCDNLSASMRLWPHLIKGEGHFVCKMRKKGEELPYKAMGRTLSQSELKLMKEITDFLKNELSLNDASVSELTSGRIPLTFGENIYLSPEAAGQFKGLSVERPGLHVAVSKKNRLEPSHSLALALSVNDISRTYDMNDTEVEKYLHGETLNCDTSYKGWTLMTYKGISLGFSKAAQGILKNHFPKGLRRM